MIGLNLCPFAKAVHAKGQVRWVLSDASTPEALLAELGEELAFLRDADPTEVDTTLIVHPQVLQDFVDYNDFLGDADELVEAMELDGVLQVASFHPQYQFADSDADDIENFTNRSPYPTLHLLREDSVSRAVEAFPDPEVIVERNVETLRKLGREGWEAVTEGVSLRARLRRPGAIRRAPDLPASDPPIRAAMQRIDVVAHGGEHPPHLVVAAFGQDQARVRAASRTSSAAGASGVSSDSSISVPLANSRASSPRRSCASVAS